MRKEKEGETFEFYLSDSFLQGGMLTEFPIKMNRSSQVASYLWEIGRYITGDKIIITWFSKRGDSHSELWVFFDEGPKIMEVLV